MPDPIFAELGLQQGVPLKEDTAIKVQCFHPLGNMDANLIMRIQLLNGNIVESRHRLQASGSGNATFIFDLTEGWLLSASVVDGNNGNLLLGLHVSMVLQTGTAVGSTPFMALAKAWAQGQAGVSWPPAIISNPLNANPQPLVLTTPDPGAGNNASFEIDSNLLVVLYHVQFLLTTDSNAATRRIILVRNGDAERYVSDITTPADQTVTYIFSPFGAADYSVDDNAHNSLPFPWYFDAGDTIDIEVDNIQAGDTLTLMAIRVGAWFKG